VAEGADVPLCVQVSRTTTATASIVDSAAHAGVVDASSRCPPAVCVAAVLGDALRRVAVLGGREGLPRSLGSVYGGSVTLFLGGSIRRWVGTRVVAYYCCSNGLAVSHDGRSVLVSFLDWTAGSSVMAFDIAGESALLKTVGSSGSRRTFHCPKQVCVASDGAVFVADSGGSCSVVELSPQLAYRRRIGKGHMSAPMGVCANADVVFVSDASFNCVCVFRRSDDSLVTRFGSKTLRPGSGDGELSSPHALCFMSRETRVVVADTGNDRVSVFTVDGEFVRHVGVGVLKEPEGVACSAWDELVIADTWNERVLVLSDVGDVRLVFGSCDFKSVAVHGDAVLAQGGLERCYMWSATSSTTERVRRLSFDTPTLKEIGDNYLYSPYWYNSD
jgi:sugar lactone lactonase YvrE